MTTQEMIQQELAKAPESVRERLAGLATCGVTAPLRRASFLNNHQPTKTMNLIHVIDSPLAECNRMTGFFHGHLERITGDDRAVGAIHEGPVIVQLNDRTLIHAEATPCNGCYLIHFSGDPSVPEYIELFGTNEKLMEWIEQL